VTLQFTDEQLSERLQAICARHLGGSGSVSGLSRLTAGATKGTWAFDAETETGIEPLILQLSSDSHARSDDDPSSQLPWLHGEEDFKVMMAGEAAGVPVPRVMHILVPDDQLGFGAVVARIEGETLGKRIVHDERYADARRGMAEDLGAIAARVHRIDMGRLPFLKKCGAQELITIYRNVLDGFPEAHPVMEFALRWASERVPQQNRESVVHGDYRMGNLIVGPEGIRAVLDWEIAHLGDPLEDIGYLCMRTWRFGGIKPVAGVGDREDLYAAYEQAGGVAVDPREARFWEVMAGIKWGLGCIRRASHAAQGDYRSIEFTAIGRRIEEPLYDLLQLIEGRD
jgi:aminoglycoside phosphotransferase (APT) family kinase protein